MNFQASENNTLNITAVVQTKHKKIHWSDFPFPSPSWGGCAHTSHKHRGHGDHLLSSVYFTPGLQTKTGCLWNFWNSLIGLKARWQLSDIKYNEVPSPVTYSYSLINKSKIKAWMRTIGAQDKSLLACIWPCYKAEVHLQIRSIGDFLQLILHLFVNI